MPLDILNKFEIDGVVFQVKIVGTIEHPWFKADDVCKALGYKDVKNAVKQHIKYALDKKSLNDIINGGRRAPPSGFRRDREGQQPYISEPGVYALIFGSKLQSAERFRVWVFEEVLPSIRKDGEYLLKRELEAADKALKAAEQEKELAQKKAIHFKQMVERRKSRERNEIVYIATTKTYAASNRFKVGSVKSVDLLKSRLATYNSGRPVEDRMYFCFIVECTRSLHLENRIKEILGDYIDGDKTTEVYVMHYSDLKFFVHLIATNYNDEVELHDVKLEDITIHLLTLEPEIPEALILNGAELRSTIGGTKKTVKVDFDTMTDTDQTEWLQKVLKEIKTFMDGDELVIERRILFDRFEREYEAKFNKVKMWKRVKSVAPELQIVIKY